MAIINLPREERFKWEKVIVCGIIPQLYILFYILCLFATEVIMGTCQIQTKTINNFRVQQMLERISKGVIWREA